jgi:hypothetical protein
MLPDGKPLSAPIRLTNPEVIGMALSLAAGAIMADEEQTVEGSHRPRSARC